MLNYFIRKILYSILILIGVNLITFLLFFTINSPDDMARMQLGEKRITAEAVAIWKKKQGYDKPLFYNSHAKKSHKFIDTLYFQKSLRLFEFDFGLSTEGRDISYDISQRMWPSLAIAIPTLLLGLLVNISFALLIALFRGTFFDGFAVYFVWLSCPFPVCFI